MDDRTHRENGRQRGDQYRNTQGQWLMQPQPSMKQIMAIMAERDAAIRDRNMAVAEKKEAISERDMAVAEKKAAIAEKDMAVAEKKAAVAERDMALLHRDSAIAERNIAIMERDNAITTLHSRENSLANSNMSSYPPEYQISRGMKHVHHQQQHSHHLPHMSETSFGNEEMQGDDTIFISQVSPEALKSQQGKRAKVVDKVSKKAPKQTKKVKRASEDLNKAMFGKSKESKNCQDTGGSDDTNKQLDGSKSDWKGHDLGLNQVAFDETTMPSPVCSCTGIYRQCYKWGNCGWQSACCTTTTSCYPLPAVPDKPKKRVGGRKMSGSAFSKLLNRLAAEGHDLSKPVDLKEHWAKHGTNRYITIK